MSNKNNSGMVEGWNAATIYAANEKRGTFGTIRKSSERTKPDNYKRPYGGTHMSIARLKAYGPTRNHVPQVNHDITM